MSMARVKTLWLWFTGGLWVGLVAGAVVGMLAAWDARHRVASVKVEAQVMLDQAREHEETLRTCERRLGLAEVLAEVHQENFGRARTLLGALVDEVRTDDADLADQLASIVIESQRPADAGEQLARWLLDTGPR